MDKYKKYGYIGYFIFTSLLGSPYTDNQNGTVTDLATGLVWQKCSAGQGTTVGNCSTGSATSYTWPNAISYCQGLNNLGFGGRFTNWRLPNVNELRSIVDYTRVNPSIDITAFPNIPNYPNYYWSSTTKGSNITLANRVLFAEGSVYEALKTWSLYVRCVTGP